MTVVVCTACEGPASRDPTLAFNGRWKLNSGGRCELCKCEIARKKFVYFFESMPSPRPSGPADK